MIKHSNKKGLLSSLIRIFLMKGDHIMLKGLLRKDGDKYVFTGEELRVYVPEDYFDKNMASDLGSYLSTFGLLTAHVVKNGEVGPLETINLPTTINMYPTELDKATLALIEGDEEQERYRVAKFYNGDTLTDGSIVKDSTNVERFLKILTGGKVPKTIPYSKVLEVWQKNLDINGIKLGVSSSVLEILIREIYRDPNKPELPFAYALAENPKHSDYNYRAVNIREICARNSTFAALTFEDMDQMINSSLNITRYGKKQSLSPIEKILKM